MKKLLISFLVLLPLSLMGKSRILAPNLASLEVRVNGDWLSPAVMKLNSDDYLDVAFDELSHTFHRYIYRIERCENDWSPSTELFESEWLEGFNDNTIDEYANSVITSVAYTHYKLRIPNDRCRLKMSGNYRIHIFDEKDDDESEILTAEFMVTEQTMSLQLEVTTNTDIDTNHSHQQLSMRLGYGNTLVVAPENQIYTLVQQNNREDNMKQNISPNMVTTNGLEWTHRKGLIFDGGNEYHKFEVLDVSHPTMGIDYIRWDGQNYQAFPFTDEARINYLYDEDADGAFYIRNSDNWEIETTCDYVWVNYRLKIPRIPGADIFIDGDWTLSDTSLYKMDYDEQQQMYTARVLQKQGYYSYQYLMQETSRSPRLAPFEGNYYQTENKYQAYVYYRGTGERTWRLVAFSQLSSF